MTGEQVKGILYQAHVSQAELAEKLNVSTQLLYQSLKAADVKSGFLERIAAALGKDMSFFYPIAPVYEQVNNNVQARNVQNDNGTINEGSGDKELINKLLEELSELRKTNQKLMDKLLG